MENILANSFSFKINHILKHYPGIPLDLQFQLANLHPGFLKSVDLGRAITCKPFVRYLRLC